MSKLLNQFGEPIESTPKPLPTTEQILQDPITKKFVFLNSEAYPEQTCIGLTSETEYSGTIYKYGKVSLPEELASEEEIEKSGLPFKFEYDILETNGNSKEKYDDKFEKLVGDILLHIIIAQSEDGQLESNYRTDSTQ
tara:strand:+ start:65 stop:478 length:414 start_codon:yes stop_codon:yes gene_type:complete